MQESETIPENNIYVNDIYLNYGLDFEGRYLFLFGGAGSGKSYFAVQKWVIRLINEEGHRLLVTRKVARTLKKSVWALFETCLRAFGLWLPSKKNKIDKEIVLPNGNQIYFVGIDDPEKLKSIDGITGVLNEEVTEQDEPDFLQVDMRLRGETKHYKQIVSCFNPTSINSFLVQHVEPNLDGDLPHNIIEFKTYENGKVWEFTTETINDKGEKEHLQTRVINTTYKDNLLIDSEYERVLKKLSAISKNHHIVYELGRWGEDTQGQLYVPSFSTSKHVAPVFLNRELELHYTVDFNTSPYMSGLVIQIEQSQPNERFNEHIRFSKIKVIKEYTLEYPNNSAFDLGKQFVEDYHPVIRRLFYLYGDASGKNSIGVKSAKSLFADLRAGLGAWDRSAQRRVPNANPRYAHISKNTLGRRNFFNRLLNGFYPVKIEVSPNCTKFIKDLKECTQDDTGRLSKKKTKGVELRGHLLQAFEYFICHYKAFGYLNKI